MHSLNVEQFCKLREKNFFSKNSPVEVLQPPLTYLEKYGHSSNYSVLGNCRLKAVKVVWVVKENLHL